MGTQGGARWQRDLLERGGGVSGQFQSRCIAGTHRWGGGYWRLRMGLGLVLGHRNGNASSAPQAPRDKGN